MEHPRCLARKHPSVARAFLILATAARPSAAASFISADCASAVPEARREGGWSGGGVGGGGRNLCLSRRGERNSDTVLKAAFIVVLNSLLHERTQRRISPNIAWGACSPPLPTTPLPLLPVRI